MAGCDEAQRDVVAHDCPPCGTRNWWLDVDLVRRLRTVLAALDDSIGSLQGRFEVLRHDPVGGSSGSVVNTPRRRETGRPRAAQFAPWAVYIPGGGATWFPKARSAKW